MSSLHTSVITLPKTVPGWSSLVARALSLHKGDVVLPPHLTFRDIKSNVSLSRNAGAPSDAQALRKSAVLVLMHPVPNSSTVDMNILLTLRTSKMRTHAGQMSFPGGRLDEGETASQAASRECMEEVGVADAQYNICGTLRPIWSHPSKSWVTPVVAVAPSDISPQIQSPDEVESIHYLNVSNLLCNSAGTHHQQVKYWPSLGCYRLPCFFASEDPCRASNGWRDPLTPTVHPGRGGHGSLVRVPDDDGLTPVSLDECDGQLVWGLTASIVAELVARMASALRVSGMPLDLRSSGFMIRDPDRKEDPAGRSKL